jgi:PGF-CTERM protein
MSSSSTTRAALHPPTTERARLSTDEGDDSGDGNRSNDSTSNESGSDGSGPGFGIVGALAGLGGAGYLLKRRVGATDGD